MYWEDQKIKNCIIGANLGISEVCLYCIMTWDSIMMGEYQSGMVNLIKRGLRMVGRSWILELSLEGWLADCQVHCKGVRGLLNKGSSLSKSLGACSPKKAKVLFCAKKCAFRLFKIFYLFFSWRIVALQNFVVFCQTSTWISHSYTYIPSLFNLPLISFPIPPL